MVWTCDSRRSGEERGFWIYTTKAESSGFLDGLDVGWEKRGAKHNTGKIALPLTEMAWCSCVREFLSDENLRVE